MSISTSTVKLDRTGLATVPTGTGKKAYSIKCYQKSDWEFIHDELKKDGFIIYAGQGGLKKSFFRISCMGNIFEDDIKRFISAVKKIVKP